CAALGRRACGAAVAPGRWSWCGRAGDRRWGYRVGRRESRAGVFVGCATERQILSLEEQAIVRRAEGHRIAAATTHVELHMDMRGAVVADGAGGTNRAEHLAAADLLAALVR